MAEYDPKRRRPTPATDDDGPAAVDALLEAVEHLPQAPDTAAARDTTTGDSVGDAVRAGGAPPTDPVPPPPVPPAPRSAPVRDISPVPAPAPGTGARSLVLVAGAAALGAIAALLVVVRLMGRRRRRRR